MNDIFVVGDERTLNSDLDLTFPYFSKLSGVRSFTYQELANSSRIASDVPLLFCFPYSLWDEIVDTQNGELYGCETFGNSIVELVNNMRELFENSFPNAMYVNKPEIMLMERDKFQPKELLAKHGIRVAENLDKSLDAVMSEVESGGAVYIKVRYGSCGKGISYISPGKWTTNFKYDGNVISNCEDDHSWREVDITGDTDFLKKLLEHEVIVEKAVTNPLTDQVNFDLRGRYFFGEVDPFFGYSRRTTGSITSASQGTTRDPVYALLSISPIEGQIKEAFELIRKSSEILGLNYSGVDVIFEGENFEPVFLELNSYPYPDKVESTVSLLHKKIQENLLQ
ncbi:hypothetical protein HQ533_04710 [Candidatus Woesearchaeota archaeon]|nr:hypothetical protein [Candidatus Woesearchaeota archaeon]